MFLPLVGLMIMDSQLSEANRITGATSGVQASGNTQFFAGMLIILFVIGGLVSLFFRVHGKVKEMRQKKDVDKNIDERNNKKKDFDKIIEQVKIRIHKKEEEIQGY